MSGANQSSAWYVDLIGVLLSSMAISYLDYLGFRDSMTGEVRNLRGLVFFIALIFGSYLLSYLLLFKRNEFLKISNWILIALVGSVLCSITFRLPLNDIELESASVRIFFFSIIASVLMGFVRLIYWISKVALNYFLILRNRNSD